MSNTGSLATQLCESMQRSQRVLYGVSLDGLTQDERAQADVRAYANTREQGFTVLVRATSDEDSLQCSFSEERGSDRLVLYIGRPSQFDFQCGIPDREVYERAEFFSTEKKLAARLQRLVRAACKIASKSYRGA